MGVHPFEQMPLVMDRYAKSLLGAVQEAVKLITEPGLTTIVDATPVDTTTAVSNWVVSHGAPFKGVHPPRVLGSVKGSGAASARQQVKAAGFARIRYYNIDVPLFITNNVRYIGYLERGGRNHSPHNMVGRGVQTMVQTAKRIRILKMTEAKV